MAYRTEDYASKGVGTAALTTGIIGTAGLALGNGLLGNLFGGANSNPASSPIYQLAQKDTEIAQLKAERSADARFMELSKEFSVLSQRVAAIEVAEPLREQNLQMQIGTLNATIARLTQTMVPSFNIAYPPPVATYAVQNPAVPTGSTTTTAQAA